ncbi:glycosyltransferase family 15 protein [Pseudoscourfieldia marina]
MLCQAITFCIFSFFFILLYTNEVASRSYFRKQFSTRRADHYVDTISDSLRVSRLPSSPDWRHRQQKPGYKGDTSACDGRSYVDNRNLTVHSDRRFLKTEQVDLGYKAVITYMVMGTCAMQVSLYARELIDNIRRVEKFWNQAKHYDIIIYHNGMLTDEIKLKIAQVSPSVIFNHVSMYLPKLVRDNTDWLLPSKIDGCGSFGTWYKHMGTLFSYQVFTDGSLDEYDYFLRFDSDYYMLRELPLDLFEELHSKGKDFAYTKKVSMPQCTRGFYEHSSKYMKSNNFHPVDKSFHADISGNAVVYFGNFAVGRVKFFAGCDYVRWAHHMMQTGGVYYARWDEQHHLPLGLSLFNKADQVLYYDLDDYFAHKCGKLRKWQCDFNKLSCTWKSTVGQSGQCVHIDALSRERGGSKAGRVQVCQGVTNFGLV